MPPPRKRADMLLVERGLFESRARARAAIEAGLVAGQRQAGRKTLRGHRAPTPCCRRSLRIPMSRAAGSSSRARWSNIRSTIEGHVCLDVGASTGGFTEVLLANGAGLVFAIDVGHGQLHPSLHGHPKIMSMEGTDIRKLEGKRLPARPDVVVIDVSFISLKAVLPVALSLAAAPMHLLALIKPQFEAARKHSKRGIIRNAMVHQEICDDIAAFAASLGCTDIQVFPSSDHRRRRQYRILPRRAPWLNDARHRSCRPSRRRRGARPRADVYVPYALAGETVEVAPVPGHPDRRRLLKIEHASPERIAPFCPHFGVCGGCAIQHWETERYRAWKRGLVVETLAQAKLECEVAPLVDAHGAGRRRITLHARMGTHDVLRSALPRPARTTSSRSTAARSSIPASTARSTRPGRSPSR